MLIIKNNNGENIERMLKRFKTKFDKTKVLKKLRDKEQYTKPSVKKRSKLQKAKYIEKKYKNDNI